MNETSIQSIPKTIVASSDEMRELLSVVRAVAPTQITVLLTGESGTGKEVFARLIHDWSSNAGGAFVTVNCGAIPEGLIESELFGHEKGSFTGANAESKGFFEAANNGTIFLDEIGEMPLAAQVKLLRVLETGSFSRVGSTVVRKTTARVIAATNRDLEQEVRSGRFRTDLYYRLRAVMLRLPPLRNRREDIPELAESVLKKIISRHSLPSIPSLDAKAIEALQSNEWRGNIRELRNTLEQLAIMAFAPGAKTYGTITAEDILQVLSRHQNESWAEPIRQDYPIVRTPVRDQTQSTELGLIYRALIELRSDIAEIKEHLYQQSGGSLRQQKALPIQHHVISEDLNVEQHERRLIDEALERFGGDRAKAAIALGISERTLYRKLRETE